MDRILKALNRYRPKCTINPDIVEINLHNCDIVIRNNKRPIIYYTYRGKKHKEVASEIDVLILIEENGIKYLGVNNG